MDNKIDPQYAIVASDWEDGYVKLYREDDRDIFNPLTLSEESRDCRFRFVFHKQHFNIMTEGSSWTVPRVGAPWTGWFVFTNDHKIVTRVVAHGGLNAGDILGFDQDSRRVDLYAGQSSSPSSWLSSSSSTRRIRRR